MVVQLRRMVFLNKIYSPRGVDFCPLSLKVVWGPPFFISFPGFTYIELQVYKLLPKSECRFYLGGMTFIGGGRLTHTGSTVSQKTSGNLCRKGKFKQLLK